MDNNPLVELDGGTFHSRVYFSSPANAFDPPSAAIREPGIIVCDENTIGLASPYGDRFERVIVPPGERCKRFSVLEQLLERFIAADLTRDDTVVAFGGGAVTDLTVFAASIYLRCIHCVLVPTTLLGMVDAAIGGKTGIDFRGYKNLVGTFAPAEEIRIVPELLASLPEREFRSGLAEVIKAACLADSELFELLKHDSSSVLRRDQRCIRTLVERAVRVKAEIVRRDLTEQGDRAYLNLGHTFAHALEAVVGLGEWTHGEAVGWGIARAMYAGVEIGITDPAWADEVISLLHVYGYRTTPVDVQPEALLHAMYRDKKRSGGAIRFVLQRGPQSNMLESLERSVIIDILNR